MTAFPDYVPDEQARLAAQSAAEAEMAALGDDFPLDPLEALYDTLNCASLAVLAAGGRKWAEAETAYMEASVATGDAFPLGSKESEALGVILAAIGRMVERRAVA